MLTLSPEDPGSPDALVLIDQLSATLAAITGDSGRAAFDPEDVRGPRAMFVVARTAAGAAVGCGAFRRLDADVAELKRMYAMPGTQAVGAALLRYLEAQAALAGYRALWLETRRVNTRAVAFYARHGYQEISNFGKYVGLPEAICLGKALRRSDSEALPTPPGRAPG